MQANNKFVLTSVAFFCLVFTGLIQAQPPTGPMSFFVTSQGSGNGGDLGGLEGADEICQSLAESVDQGHLTWRAYLSTQGDNAANARDRIGPGPWFNANGYRVQRMLIASTTLTIASPLRPRLISVAASFRGRLPCRTDTTF